MRLDAAMVARGLAPTRARARDAVLRGCVQVDGLPAGKPGASVRADAEIAVDDPALAYVSRGALKLAAALDAFAVDPDGRVCLDIGASTGGFSQLLLQRGARRVHAVDVGHGQLAATLRDDPRIILREGVNARDLTRAQIGEPVDLVTIDVSFIPLGVVLPAVLALAAPGADLVALVKPQFEVGPENLDGRGIVRDGAAAQAAADAVAARVAALGWTPRPLIASPIEGGSGNREFLLGARRD